MSCGVWPARGPASSDAGLIAVARLDTLPSPREPWGRAVAQQIARFLSEKVNARGLRREDALVVPVLDEAIQTEDEAITVARRQGLDAIVWGTTEKRATMPAKTHVVYNGHVAIHGDVNVSDRSSVTIASLVVRLPSGDTYSAEINVTLLHSEVDGDTSRRNISFAALLTPITLRNAWPRLETVLDLLSARHFCALGRPKEARTRIDRALGRSKDDPSMKAELRMARATSYQLDGDTTAALAEIDRLMVDLSELPLLLQRNVRQVRSILLGSVQQGVESTTEFEAGLDDLRRAPTSQPGDVLRERMALAFVRALNGDVSQFAARVQTILSDAKGTGSEPYLTYLARSDSSFLEGVLGGTRDFSASQAHLQRALELHRESETLRRQCEPPDVGWDAINQGVEAHYLLLLGQCSESAKLLDAALPILETLATRDPVAGYKGLADAYYAAVWCLGVARDGVGAAPRQPTRWPQDVSAERLSSALGWLAKYFRLASKWAREDRQHTEDGILIAAIAAARAYFEKAGYGSTPGVLVLFEQEEGSPIRGGDYITHCDGQPVRDIETLSQKLSSGRGRTKAALRFLRNGESREITVSGGRLKAYLLWQAGDVAHIRGEPRIFASGTTYLL